MQDTLTIVLAGGVGSRLSPLTDNRAKPAVPFGGKYRIIDFTLANCLHSGLRQILVLTQYKSHSLQKHLRDGWSVLNPELGEYITNVPPQMRTGDSWYSGTADAIYQNLYLLSRSEAKHVVVLSGDHIYRMDYAPMLKQHKKNEADLTVACMEVSIDEAKEFGVMEIDESLQINNFTEKPRYPASVPGRPTRSMASMGIYIFDKEVLTQALLTDAKDPSSSHDFGKDIIPKLVGNNSVYAYKFGDTEGRVTQDAYWRDVGTLDSYYQANMDLLKPVSPIDLYQPDWAIRTYEPQLPPARTVASVEGNQGIFINSMIANGVVIEGGSAQNSIFFPKVKVSNAAIVIDSILFEDVEIGKNCHIQNCIIDKNVKVPDDTQIGINSRDDAERFHVSKQGVIVVPSSYKFS
ncbi:MULTISPECIES: glucose-1-phosphate adenylyltransferase [Vibrio]|uniref:Glucose-1-phosphate adenylyltransferase n=1 Tax=Vibrio kanaloae TaxID=170673 RepID=A0A2N7J8I4_9VIBR|nr:MULTISPECIES: glucose-1-phosphate adenylyltransferase [Vibrio]NOI98239.1 glucose-1-phosphate adenylyltransferase [Vibrio kanaloae]OEF12882.1 glucose-1-phosphate adenylyltransferase [Vibrio kanaloae 5S-149]PMM02450.1 glucose-1-phosphate adenylyltransferase [Vibrio kanaloae]QPK06687.1 glucose-1-phosphate adenylyltransferase [Vibrio kanaloae]TKE91975.1 glucose-1-phosphate adenylyltransferase [Vibrio kanaloae]